MPQRKSLGGNNPVGQLNSTPASRSGSNAEERQVIGVQVGTGASSGAGNDSGGDSGGGAGTGPTTGEAVVASGVSVGQPAGDTGVQDRINSITATNSSTPVTGVTSAEQALAEREAVATRKKGVLGCTGAAVSGGGGAAASGNDCGDCETIDCLGDLLESLLPSLPDSAKGLLCNIASETEKAAKRQLDAAGNALLDAATELASADALQAPLQEINKVLDEVDPGAIANCFGAQGLIDSVQGELGRVNNVIADAEAGVQDRIAESFNEGIEATQQWSAASSLCDE